MSAAGQRLNHRGRFRLKLIPRACRDPVRSSPAVRNVDRFELIVSVINGRVHLDGTVDSHFGGALRGINDLRKTESG